MEVAYTVAAYGYFRWHNNSIGMHSTLPDTPRNSKNRTRCSMPIISRPQPAAPVAVAVVMAMDALMAKAAAVAGMELEAMALAAAALVTPGASQPRAAVDQLY